MNIKEVREKYPQYNDLSDLELADAFHSKFYSDIPRNEFYSKMGLENADFLAYKQERIESEKTPLPARIAEGVSRGVQGLGQLVAGGVGELAKSPEAILPTAQEAFQKGAIDLVNLPIMASAYGLDVIKRPFRSEEQTFKADFARKKFFENLEKQRQEFTSVEGAKPIASEALSLALDPATVMSFGVGALAKAPSKVSRLAKVAEVGEDVSRAVAKPFTVISEGLERTGQALDKTIIPDVTKGLSKVSRTAETVPSTMASIFELGKGIAEKSATPSQISELRRIANDSTFSTIARRTANVLDNTPIVPVLKTSGDFAKGVLSGGATGAGMALLTGQDVGEGIGMGGGLGGMGYIGGKLATKGKRFKEAQAADRNAFIERHASDPDFAGVDLSKVDQATLQKAADMEILGGGKFEIRFINDDMAKQMGKTGLGSFISGENGVDRILINTDRIKNGRSTIAHEVGHSIYNSSATDAPVMRGLLDVVYGEDGIKKRMMEYVAKDYADRTGIPPKDITAGEIAAHAETISAERGTPNWIYSELFAEHFNDFSSDKAIKQLMRREGVIGRGLQGIKSKVASTARGYLENLGIPLKENGSVDAKLFSEHPLAKDPAVSKAVENYQRDFFNIKKGIDKVKNRKEGEGYAIPYSQLKKLDIFQLKPDQNENAIYYRDAGGVIREKPLERLKKERLQMQAGVRAGIFARIPYRPEGVGGWGKRSGREVNGDRLYDISVENGLTDPNYLRNAETVDKALENQRPVSFMYIPETLDSGKEFRPSARNVVPLNYSVNKEGHVKLNAYDMDYIATHANNLAANERLGLWNNSPTQFVNDIKKVGDAHAKGLSGSDAVGKSKYDFIRAVFGFTKDIEDVNRAGGMYRQFFVDRIVNPRQNNDAFTLDYYKMKTGQKPQ